MWAQCNVDVNIAVYAERELTVEAVHPLIGRRLPVFIILTRQYGEFSDVDLGEVSVCWDWRQM